MIGKESDKDLIKLYFTEKIRILEDIQKQNIVDKILALADLVWNTYQNNGTLFACANGGGAGLIDNLTTDLSLHPFVSEDKSVAMQGVRRLRAINLGASTGVLTGLSNDLGYENVFVGQLRGEMTKNDMIIGFSGSGNSKNILSAFEYASTIGANSVCISGRGGGKANEIASINIVIPGISTFPGQTGGNQNNFHIEDLQVEITHILTGIIKYRVQSMNHA